MKCTDFVVMRDDLQQGKFVATQLPDVAAVADDALLVKIDRFAFTPTRSKECWRELISRTHRAHPPRFSA